MAPVQDKGSLMALSIPAINKTFQVSTSRLAGQISASNLNHTLVVNGSTFIDLVARTLSSRLELIDPLVGAGAAAYDKANNFLWAHKGPQQFARVKVNELNRFEYSGDDLVTAPASFPTSFEAMAVYGNVVFIIDDTIQVKCFRYDPDTRDMRLIPVILTIPGFDTPVPSARQAFLDVRSTYLMLAFDNQSGGGIWERTISTDGIPIIGTKVADDPLYQCIANAGSRRDTFVYYDPEHLLNQGQPIIDIEEDTVTGVRVRAIDLERNTALAVPSVANSLTYMAHVPDILDPSQVVDGIENLGDIVLTAIEWDLSTSTIARQTTGQGSVTITSEPEYSKAGDAQLTCLMHTYQPHHLLLSGWVFSYGGIRYRLERIYTGGDNNDEFFGVFNAAII